MTDSEYRLQHLVSVGDWVRWGASYLATNGVASGHGLDNSLDEALYLVLRRLGLPADCPVELLHATLLPAERQAVQQWLHERVQSGRPASYITGHARFCGLDFHVDERVLVPRSPIAELIEQRFSPWLADDEPQAILDLCTGSGCIGIACAYAFPEAEVVLSDLSPEALDVARQNVSAHELESRVAPVLSNVYSGLSPERFDLIVSNPPYVPEADMATLPREYHAEPRLGLAAGPDGLDVVRRILAQAYERLNPGGLLVVEVGDAMDEFASNYPDLPVVWPEFERGGHGVFVIHREQLADVAQP